MKKLKFAIRYLKHKLFSNFYHLGWRVIIENNVNLRGTEYMSLGNHVTLDSNSLLYVISHPKYNDLKPKLILEDSTGVSAGAIILAAKKIHIKKDAMLGPNSVITDYNYFYENIDIPIREQGFTLAKPVIIDEGVWVGANTTICPGVTIGKNAVIGANSVVTKNIPAYSLAVGTPAKVIKQYNLTLKKWERIAKS